MISRRMGLGSLLACAAAISLLGPGAPVWGSKSAPPKPLLVLAGASGRLGREVLVAASKSGWRVRALTSDVARARRELGSAFRHGEWLQIDMADAAAVAAAMQGADHVVSALGAHGFKDQDVPERVDFLANSRLIDAASAARVKHFVFITSGTGGTHRNQAEAPALMHVRFWKTRAEEQLRASGLSYTVIGPGGLTLEPARRIGLRILPREQYVSTDVSRADVARVAVHALLSPDAANKTFALVNDSNTTLERWREQLPEFPADRPTEGGDAAVARLDWMAGHWEQLDADGKRTEEVWLAPAGGMLLGMARLTTPGRRAWYENLRIESRPDGSAVYVGAPQGQTPTDFKLTSVSGNRVSFFNLGHDFPQGIHYLRDGDELKARVDGVDKGRIVALEYRYQLVAGR